MQTYSTNTFEMPNGVTVIMDFEPMDFVMNPETEDLIRGDRLREGMIVLLEGCHMRQDPKNFETTDSAYTRQRCLETARWCTVTDIRRSRNNRDVLSFIGLYADGTKFERMYNESFTWFVKLDSMPKEVEFDDPIEESRIAAEAIQEAEDYDRLHGDLNDIDEMDASFPHPSDTDVYKD